MAVRQIREIGDPILNKKAKPVTEMTPRLKELIADMKETMYEAGGVGLAAPQVGILKRIVVIDVSPEQNEPHVFVNPQIVETSGEQEGYEGCLSIPGKSGWVKRPAYGSRLKSREPSFSRAACATSSIIWTVTCIPKLRKAA